MTEASLAARGLGQGRTGLDRGPGDRGEDKLRDPVAPPHDVGARPEIDEQHLDLPAVVGVDRPRGVRHPDRVARGEAASRADLSLVSRRDLETDSGRDREDLPRRDLGVALEGGYDIHPRRVLRLVGGRRDRVGIEHHTNRDMHRHATAPGTRSEASNTFSVWAPSATRQRRSRERISLATRRTSSAVIRSTEAISSSTGTYRPV